MHMIYSISSKVIFSVPPKRGAPRSSYTMKNGCKTVKQDVVAFVGKCIIIAEADEFWGGEESKPYRSPVLENPTWGRVLDAANSSLRKTGDLHHVFLEGLEVKPPITVGGEKVTVLELIFGS